MRMSGGGSGIRIPHFLRRNLTFVNIYPRAYPRPEEEFGCTCCPTSFHATARRAWGLAPVTPAETYPHQLGEPISTHAGRAGSGRRLSCLCQLHDHRDVSRFPVTGHLWTRASPATLGGESLPHHRWRRPPGSPRPIECLTGAPMRPALAGSSRLRGFRRPDRSIRHLPPTLPAVTGTINPRFTPQIARITGAFLLRCRSPHPMSVVLKPYAGRTLSTSLGANR